MNALRGPWKPSPVKITPRQAVEDERREVREWRASLHMSEAEQEAWIENRRAYERKRHGAAICDLPLKDE